MRIINAKVIVALVTVLAQYGAVASVAHPDTRLLRKVDRSLLADCPSESEAAFFCAAGIAETGCGPCITNAFEEVKDAVCLEWEITLWAGIGGVCKCSNCKSEFIALYECQRPECGKMDGDLSGLSDDDSCFSPMNTVEVQGKGLVRMDSLQIGDNVKTANDKFSRVYSFGHFGRGEETEYIQINQGLEVSAEHLLYLYNKSLVPAGDVEVGDFLLSAEHGDAAVEIVSTRKVVRRGAYAPLTYSGDIVVNGVVASNYVTRAWLSDKVSARMLHWLQHGAALPYRVYCAMRGGCQKERYAKSTGFSPWVQFWYRVEQWQLRLGSVGQAAVLSLLAVPAMFVMVTGKLMMDWSAVHIVAAVVAFIAWKKMNQKKNRAGECAF